MSVFVAFSDETAVGDPLGTFLMGGYAANEKEWPWFAGPWQERVLDGPPAIPYLHIRDIRREAWRARHGISYNQAEDRVSEAVRVIFSSGGVCAIGSHMRRGDLEETIQSSLRAQGVRPPIGLDELDYLCFISYAAFCLAHIYKIHPEVQMVNFVVSRKNKISQHVAEFHEQLKMLIASPLDGIVGHLIPGDMQSHLPLQAADVLCWHMQRYFAKTMDPVDEHRLWYLGESSGMLHEITRPDLEHMSARFVSLVRSKTTSI